MAKEKIGETEIESTRLKVVAAGGKNYGIAAKEILTASGGLKTYEDIEALVTAGFTIEVPWTATDYGSSTAPTAEKLATIPAGVAAIYNSGTKPSGVETWPVGTLSASTSEARKHIYLIYHPHATKDSFDEYVSTGSAWELIGNTDIDLSGYMQKGVKYTSAALENGAHTHSVTGSVTVPTISHTDKKLSASATDVAVAADGTASAMPSDATFTTTVTPTTTNLKATATGTDLTVSKADSYIKSYPGSFKSLATTTVTGVSGSTTASKVTTSDVSASKATAGTATTISIDAIKSASIGTVSSGQDFSVPTNAIKTASLAEDSTSSFKFATSGIASAALAEDSSSTFKYNTDAIKAASCNQSFLTSGLSNVEVQNSGSDFVVAPSVDANGVLSFSFGSLKTTAATPTAVSISTTPATKQGVKISTSDASTQGIKISTSSADTQGYKLSTTAADALEAVPYSFSDVSASAVTASDITVPVAASSATTVATGGLTTGTDIMIGLGAATTGTPVSAVSIKNQPTVTLSTDGSSGDVVVATGITSASTSASGTAITALTGVKVTAQPTITLATGATGDVDIVETITTSTTTATVSGTAASDGAHTHDIQTAA